MELFWNLPEFLAAAAQTIRTPMNRRRINPYLVTAICAAMVPGIPAFEMMIYFSRSDMLNGLESAVRTALIAGAIGSGLSMARLVTEITLQE